MTEKVNTVLIASGSGTDANSIMEAYAAGFIENINLKGLFSTRATAGCIEKACALDVPTKIIDRRGFGSLEDFNFIVRDYLLEMEAELVFLVGCIVKMFPISGIDMYNIHPADPEDHGGDNMYGLDVHRHVLLKIRDLIWRGKKKIDDRFFTLPTVHEVNEKYDDGQILDQRHVEIPSNIIERFINRQDKLGVAAKKLQKHVLPYEWLMLPSAVKASAKKIIDLRG